MSNPDAIDLTGRFLDRLINQQDPQHKVDPALREAKILCGRWLALRRIRLHYSLAALTELTNISEEALLFVETGLADISLATDTEWVELAQRLAGHWHDAQWVWVVLVIALSSFLTPDQRIMRRVIADLQAVLDDAEQHYAPEDDPSAEPLPQLQAQVSQQVVQLIPSFHRWSKQPVNLTIADIQAALCLKVGGIRSADWLRACFATNPGILSSYGLTRPALLLVNAYLERGKLASLCGCEHVRSSAQRKATMRCIQLQQDPGNLGLIGFLEASVTHYNRPLLENAEDYLKASLLDLTTTPPLTDSAVLMRELPLSTDDGLEHESPIVRLSRRRSFEELLLASPRMLLIGEPGSGKSSCLQYLALRLSLCMLDATAPIADGWSEPKLPLLLSLPRFAASLEGANSQNEHELLHHVLLSTVPTIPFEAHELIIQKLRQGQALLLFDDLDKLPEISAGKDCMLDLLTAIATIAKALPKTTPIVLACRSDVYSSIQAVLDDTLLEQDSWRSHTIQPLSSAHIRELLELLDSSRSRGQAAEQSTSREPSEVLFARIQAQPTLLTLYSSPLHLTMLMAIVQARSCEAIPSSRIQLYQAFELLLKKSSMPLCMQEFLLARELAALPQLSQHCAERWYRPDGERWRFLLRLAVGWARHAAVFETHAKPWLWQLLSAVLPNGLAKSSPQQYRDLILAAESYLEELADGMVVEHDQLADVLVERLRIARMELPNTDLHQNLHIAQLLTRLGEWHTGLGSMQPEWCRISETFHIARYLVTNAQWHSFIQDQGYHKPTCWGSFWSVCVQEHWTQPLFWEDLQPTHASLPVVGISWYEAMAYCAWLTTQGQAAGWLAAHEEIRLPNVDEWVLAAYGAEQRSYPWGKCWDCSMANTSECELGTASPVGCFAHAATPEGVFDMIGNVAEWCGNDPVQLARCGGSWAETIEQSRIVRPVSLASTRGNLLGMRLLRVLKRS